MCLRSHLVDEDKYQLAAALHHIIYLCEEFRNLHRQESLEVVLNTFALMISFITATAADIAVAVVQQKTARDLIDRVALTSFPLSLKYLLNRLCASISISCAASYLREWRRNSSRHSIAACACRQLTNGPDYLSARRMASFCASACMHRTQRAIILNIRSAFMNCRSSIHARRFVSVRQETTPLREKFCQSLQHRHFVM